MARINPENSQQSGQALLLSVLFLGLLSTLLVGFFQFSIIVREKIRLQISADAAILSALNCEANALNSIALANRAVLANDALAAQLNALVSESSFYRKLAERFSRLLRFVPYAGAVGLFLSKGIRTMEIVVRRTASIALPLAYLSNRSLEATRQGVHYVLPYNVLKAAQKTLSKNMPHAELHPMSKIALVRQARNLQKSLTDLDEHNLEKLRIETMDSHTKRRNWKISVAGISPVKKTGNTRLGRGRLIAQDKMKMKVFRRLRLRWKTVLASQSNAEDFGYRQPENPLTILERKDGPILSLGIVVQSTPSDVPGGLALDQRKLTAVSAASLVYKRESKPGEIRNTLNPFWNTQLIPVASETTLRKFFPESVLKQLRH